MAQSGKREASMVTLFFANVLYWVCAGVYSPFLSAHYTSLGLSAAQTGILLAATPVCALAIQPLWSTIADKLGRRRAVIVILCLAAAVLAPLYYLASTFVPVLLVTFACSAFFSGLLPLSDSLVIERADKQYDVTGIQAIEKARDRYEIERRRGCPGKAEDFAAIDETMLQRTLRDISLLKTA